MDWIGFIVKSDTAHTLDSPSLISLYQIIHKPIDQNNAYILQIEAWRQDCLKNQRVLPGGIMGAGSKITPRNRTVSDIARSVSSGPHKCRILMRLTDYFKPASILELGTALGISSAYLAISKHVSHVSTMEGSTALYELAKEFCSGLNHKIELINTSFEDGLAQLSALNKKFDFIYIDGDHSYESTLAYFEWSKRALNPNGIIVIDDIYWSSDMKAAWKEIRESPDYNLTVDFFYAGLVTNSDKLGEPIHAMLNPFWFKWKLGFLR